MVGLILDKEVSPFSITAALNSVTVYLMFTTSELFPSLPHSGVSVIILSPTASCANGLSKVHLFFLRKIPCCSLDSRFTVGFQFLACFFLQVPPFRQMLTISHVPHVTLPDKIQDISYLSISDKQQFFSMANFILHVSYHN